MKEAGVEPEAVPAENVDAASVESGDAAPVENMDHTEHVK
jgi:hypothetical protein